jgi:cytosine/adenosine deaminase-related metal-dependent hydrolase
VRGSPMWLYDAGSTMLRTRAVSGLRSPCTGKLGVVEEGARADLLLVDGNPLANTKLVENPARNFVVIMKDGKFYKNLLAPRAS